MTDNLINPKKPETINLSDNIDNKSNIDINKIRRISKQLNNEPWLST